MANNNKAFEILRRIDPSLRVTGIGSVPFLDPDDACVTILNSCPLIPYVPQLIKRDFRESMFVQFSENLPFLVVDPERKHVFFDERLDRERELDEFYENVVHNRYDYFRISPEYACGLPVMLEKCRALDNSCIKTQVTGPVTYLMSLAKRDGKSVIFDDDFSEAMMFGLAMKGLWQTREIRKIGKTPILFFDEPSLGDVSSAYTPVTGEWARSLMKSILGFVKNFDPDLLIGIHCCSNTDWGMLLGLGVDIVSLDSCSCGDRLMLYPDEVRRFLQKGGFIAYGIVPMSKYSHSITEEHLYDKFMSLLDGFEERGIAKREILDSAIFTPACGMGPLRVQDAGRILDLVISLTERIQERHNP